MDVAAFKVWLDGLVALTLAQRRQAWQALALSEALDSPAIELRAVLDPSLASVDVAPAANKAPALQRWPEARPSAPVGAAGVAAPGQRRVDSLGCPHGDSRVIVR